MARNRVENPGLDWLLRIQDEDIRQRVFAAVAKLQALADVLDEDQQGLRRVLLKIARELEGKQS